MNRTVAKNNDFMPPTESPFYYKGITAEEFLIEEAYHNACWIDMETRIKYQPIWKQIGQKMNEITFFFEGMTPYDFVVIAESFSEIKPQEIIDIQLGKHNLPLEERTRENVFKYFGIDQDV